LSILLGLAASSSSPASSIAYERVSYRRFVAHVVTVNLADPQVKVSVALAAGGAGRCERFRSMMNRTRPAAAITGTFFDTKSLQPTGDIALFGTVVHSGCIGSALCLDSNNRAQIVPLKKGRKTGWTGYETVLCAGPTLVANGKVGIELKHEGFRRSLMSHSRRTAVGITESGKLILVCVNRKASLYDVAKLMIKLNARSAVSLDGGSSTALYYQGGYFACPGRTLTNCLVVYSSTRAYNGAKTALAPARVLAKAAAK
jgi:exopolysaccharide biosynthesis protein